MSQQFQIVMPYLVTISVNRAYNRNNPRCSVKAEVNTWCILLAGMLRQKLMQMDIPQSISSVRLDITIHRKTQRGRRPDTSNFRKIPQDTIAAVLGVDDSIFYGTDHPVCAPIAEHGFENAIVFDITVESK